MADAKYFSNKLMILLIIALFCVVLLLGLASKKHATVSNV